MSKCNYWAAWIHQPRLVYPQIYPILIEKKNGHKDTLVLFEGGF